MRTNSTKEVDPSKLELCRGCPKWLLDWTSKSRNSVTKNQFEFLLKKRLFMIILHFFNPDPGSQKKSITQQRYDICDLVYELRQADQCGLDQIYFAKCRGCQKVWGFKTVVVNCIEITIDYFSPLTLIRFTS